MGTLISPEGGVHGKLFSVSCGERLVGVSSRIWVMILFQTGVAPVIPDAIRDMGVLSKFPTQTATRYSGVYPIVQLSRIVLVVPVFTATVCPGMLSLDKRPKAGMRALGSDRIWLMMKATRGSSWDSDTGNGEGSDWSFS